MGRTSPQLGGGGEGESLKNVIKVPNHSIHINFTLCHCYFVTP